ncbi:MAG: hypothetical protein Q8J62_01185, partial [Candidatus Cloacimonadaceae bacterium]|nr:hypothetical protein [Candidatus Cloacimonadaceae bacterium]
MHKYLLVSVILLLLGLNLFAKDQSTKVSNKMKVIPIAGVILDMHYTADLQKLSVKATFDVPRNSIDAFAYNGFFLNKNARIESIQVGNIRSAMFFINGADCASFEPVLAIPKLMEESSLAKFYGFYLNGFENYPETVRIVLDYVIYLPDFVPNEIGKPGTGLSAAHYWYPHNISGPTMVEFNALTTQYFNIILGNSFATYKD